MPPGRILAVLFTALCCFMPDKAWADYDITYSSDGGQMRFEYECPYCGSNSWLEYDRDSWTYDDAYDDAQNYLADRYCEDC